PFADGGEDFNVVDFAQGPDGNLYYLVVAADFSVPSGLVVRVDYAGVGNQPPIPVATASPAYGDAPLDVAFSPAGSTDPDTAALSYLWSFGDGNSFVSGLNVNHRYSANGQYRAMLSVSDGQAVRSTAVVITVGDLPPRITLLSPPAGLLYED